MPPLYPSPRHTTNSVSTMNESALCPRCKETSIRSVYKENL
jgi:hypothetical protein